VPPSGKGAKETQEILSKLTLLNAGAGGKGYPKEEFSQSGGRDYVKGQIVRLDYRNTPIAINDRLGALNVISCDQHGQAEVWFPSSRYYCAEVNPDDPRIEYSGNESHCEGAGVLDWR